MFIIDFIIVSIHARINAHKLTPVVNSSSRKRLTTTRNVLKLNTQNFTQFSTLYELFISSPISAFSCETERAAFLAWTILLGFSQCSLYRIKTRSCDWVSCSKNEKAMKKCVEKCLTQHLTASRCSSHRRASSLHSRVGWRLNGMWWKAFDFFLCAARNEERWYFIQKCNYITLARLSWF